MKHLSIPWYMEEMATKRKRGRVSDESCREESCDEVEVERKKLKFDVKTQLLRHGEVDIYGSELGETGITYRKTFISNVRRKSFEEIKQHVAAEDTVTLDDLCYLHAAFKEGLLRILGEIEEVLNDESSKVRVILVHGVPRIGKSTLAECLAYYLALYAGGNDLVQYIHLRHSPECDSEDLTKKVMLQAKKYVVVDQANVHKLELEYIQKKTQVRYDVDNIRMPILIFTSGHYSPSDIWLETQRTGWLKYKLIDLEVDAACVKRVMDTAGMEATGRSANDILDLTRSFGHMFNCVQYLKAYEHSTEEEIFDRIYPGASLEKMKGDTALHFMWLVWQKFLTVGVPPEEDLTDDDCSLEPCFAEYLAYLMSDMKDTNDRGIRSISNMTKISGKTQFKSNGYKEFKTDSYKYQIVRRKCLYDVLKLAFSIHARYSEGDRHNVLVAALRVLSSPGQTWYQYVTGAIFEMVIRSSCKKASEEKKRAVGMRIQSGLDFENVDYTTHVRCIGELCDIPRHLNMMKKVKKDNFIWGVLNVDGKRQIPGYDFAFMLVTTTENKTAVSSLQLLHVTVNPKGKSRDQLLTMSYVLDEIKNTLLNANLVHDDIDRVVVPYIVQPSRGGTSVILPFRDSKRKLEVEVVEFPQYILGL